MLRLPYAVSCTIDATGEDNVSPPPFIFKASAAVLDESYVMQRNGVLENRQKWRLHMAHCCETTHKPLQRAGLPLHPLSILDSVQPFGEHKGIHQ